MSETEYKVLKFRLLQEKKGRVAMGEDTMSLYEVIGWVEKVWIDYLDKLNVQHYDFSENDEWADMEGEIWVNYDDKSEKIIWEDYVIIEDEYFDELVPALFVKIPKE
jgi:hypothetical protein